MGWEQSRPAPAAQQAPASRPSPGREPTPEQLLPAPFRRAAARLLAACVAVAVVLGLFASHAGRPNRLDALLDPWFQAQVVRWPGLFYRLPELGTLGPVTLMTLALILAFAASRRWSGAVLAAVAVPIATGLTEYVLKPLIGGTYPSGHATSLFALAAICAVLLARPYPFVSRAVRLALALGAVLAAGAVAITMVIIGAHFFTDAVGGTAVGIGIVLACAFALDFLAGRAAAA